MDDEMNSLSDDDCDLDDDYYKDADDDLIEEVEGEEGKKLTADIEVAQFECLTAGQVEEMFKESTSSLVESLSVSPSIAVALLHGHHWNLDTIRSLMASPESSEKTLADCGMGLPRRGTDSPTKRTNRTRSRSPDPTASSSSSSSSPPSSSECRVCATDHEDMRSLSCGHAFCRECWTSHVEMRLSEGVSLSIPCMHSTCTLVLPQDFILSLPLKPTIRARFDRLVFRAQLESHPDLRYCPGPSCEAIIRTTERKAKRITCTQCSTTFCASCGQAYHAPTHCDTIKLWTAKCADDSETANYISAHTKDCPQCNACIEKNGGCNHMQCAKCKHHFCWMCFGDWKSHGSEYYECSRYKENPEVATEANHVKARRALERYLHYYERYENHNKSLKMEEHMRDRLRRKIDEKVKYHEGTWIDWQYLHDAATLLTRCRYTLKYTYPYAYYCKDEEGGRKELFEYQQAQLEKEVEDLAWAVERVESEARGNLQSHMHRAEHKRLTLLEDFFVNHATGMQQQQAAGLPSTSKQA